MERAIHRISAAGTHHPRGPAQGRNRYMHAVSREQCVFRLVRVRAERRAHGESAVAVHKLRIRARPGAVGPAPVPITHRILHMRTPKSINGWRRDHLQGGEEICFKLRRRRAHERGTGESVQVEGQFSLYILSCVPLFRRRFIGKWYIPDPKEQIGTKKSDQSR